MKNIILLFLVLTNFFSLGQDSACKHKVTSGETLYAISRKYDTELSELKKLNKDLTSQLSLDQEIIVPCNRNLPATVVSTSVITLEEVVPVTDEFNGNFIFHTIVKGETVYSLTNKFGISETQFYTHNPDVKRNGLKVNGVVMLYQKDKTSEDEQLIDKHFLKVKSIGNLNVFNPDSNKLEDSSFVNIAVMLPFQFERNIEFLKKFKDEQEPQLYSKTKIFLELYQGIKMAVDSVVESGLNVQLFVFDTKADTSEIRSIINQPVIQHMDLIIGPGFTNTFVFAANLLRNQSIPMISPFSKKEAVLKGNPFSIRIIPSEKSHFKAIGKYVSENFLDQNIIIATQDSNDRANAKLIQREIIANSLLIDSSDTVIPKITQGIYIPIENLKDSAQNIIILANNKEAFASKIVAKLVPQSSKKVIKLFGLDDLKEYKNIEVDYWDSLNIHISSSNDVKYGYPLADNFIHQYFKKYYSEPSSYAFTGYDFTLIVLNQLLYDRKYAHNKLVGSYFVGGLRDYEFKYNGDNNGISNNSVFVYKYSNFKLIKLND